MDGLISGGPSGLGRQDDVEGWSGDCLLYGYSFFTAGVFMEKVSREKMTC